MSRQRKSSLQQTAALCVAALALTMVTASCQDEQRTYVDNLDDPYRVPTMVTTDVSTLISDSGYTRYHITTPTWRMYQDIDDPLWKFPDGIELEQYDNNMMPAARLRCDSAIYFERRRLWRLDGHVVMVNTANDTFLTPQLYWDQNRAKVYSDSFMHITRAQHIIEGYGFESNQNMSAYTVHKPTAIIPVGARRPGSGGLQHTDSARSARTDQPRMAPTPASQRSDRDSYIRHF